VDQEGVQVNVIVTVRASPEDDSVAVLDSSVRVPSVPPVPEAFRTPTWAIVTGSESEPFAVNVLVSVAVDVPVVCAYVACAATRPPEAVVI